jgi:peptide-N4-(N-acetyl-beta-glucosaminyl)asparagine amidase
MKFVGVRGPITLEERAGLASRVEVYQCQVCPSRIETYFPRFNHPRTLMTWRKGRCGEWANCFCALAVSAGFRARFILDLTDHVWGEIFSPDQKRWIHCDPCENTFDAPLMYEAGWGKKLSWVFAFETGGYCLDVTRRYSKKWDTEMIQRRLNFHSLQLTRVLRSRAPPSIEPAETEEFSKCVQETLPKRNQGAENGEAQLLKPEEARGRISGSEEWRKARGEFGNDKKEFHARYQALIAQGKSPNEAAIKALREMMEEKAKLQNGSRSCKDVQ